MTDITKEVVFDALSKVIDPELNRPITELNMVDNIDIDGSHVTVTILLTIAGCPMKGPIKENATAVLMAIDGIDSVDIQLGVMTDEQKEALREKLAGPQRAIPFAQPDSLTKVFAVTSGKGGVGKSTMTANLARAMAKDGLKVGIVDCDIYGFSIPRMMGVGDNPTIIDSMIVPPVTDEGIKVISIGMFVPDGQAVIWRGPMLHRALQQFLADVFWGDLDVLLLDMPPGTGDVAISIAQLLPTSEILVVTTPQVAASEVAERAGAIAAQTQQSVVGVVENMSYLIQPDGSHLEVFGSGGGEATAAHLSASLNAKVPLLGKVPLDISLRESGDKGQSVIGNDGPAAREITKVARALAGERRGLAGKQLGVHPV